MDFCCGQLALAVLPTQILQLQPQCDTANNYTIRVVRIVHLLNDSCELYLPTDGASYDDVAKYDINSFRSPNTIKDVNVSMLFNNIEDALIKLQQLMLRSKIYSTFTQANSQ